MRGNLFDQLEVVRFVRDFLLPYRPLVGEEHRFYLVAYNAHTGYIRNALLPIDDQTPFQTLCWVQSLDQPANVAFGILPRYPLAGEHQYGVPKELWHSIPACYLIADLDRYQLTDQQVEHLQQMGARWIVHSGYGYHLYFPIQPINAAEFRSACQLLIRKLHAMGLPADPKVHDPARVLRLPGTVNWKEPYNPQPCFVFRRMPTRTDTTTPTAAQIVGTEYQEEKHQPQNTTAPEHKPRENDRGAHTTRQKTYLLEFACEESYRQWIEAHPALATLPVERTQSGYSHNTGSGDASVYRIVVNTNLPFRKRYLGGLMIRQTEPQNAPYLPAHEVYQEQQFELEVELATARALRKSYPRVALILPYLQRLKRERYPHGIVPAATMVQYLQTHVLSSRGNPIDRSICYKALQDAQRIGILTKTNNGYIVHRYTRILQQLAPESTPQLVKLQTKEWNSLATMKRTLALLPGLYRTPWQKATIAKEMGVHLSTVKRNRHGCPRAWNKERLNNKPVDKTVAEQLRTEHYHRGYKPLPQREETGFVVWRYSAAKTLNLLCLLLRRKTRRLRRTLQQRHATEKGNPISRYATQETEQHTTNGYPTTQKGWTDTKKVTTGG